uniref:Calpain 15 n=1 Tax=Plectus sambesii TaxID=2011161 RepID=A0A914WD44_9BILA
MTRWACVQCTLENGLDSSNCAACGLSKDQSRPTIPQRPPRNVSNSWDCYSCSYRNEGRLTCEMCDAPKLGSRPQTSVTIKATSSSSETSPSSNGGGWNCMKCKVINNDVTVLDCHQCQQKRSMWNCPQCTLENPIGRAKCEACAARNPTRPKPPSVAASNAAKAKSPDTNEVEEPFSPRVKSDFMEHLRTVDEQKANETFRRIIEFCRSNRSNFVDDGFPPTEKSIGRFPDDEFAQVPNRARPKNLLWVRPAEIYTKDGRRWRWSVFNNPSPTDIEQGVLGNCWFLSALAVIAERPDLLEHIVLTKHYYAEGVYQIRLCVDGAWQIITVDDHFPCYQNHTMAFTVGRRNQLWVPLIEKALAKVFGSYATLRAGRSVEGLALLTGAPCEFVSLERDSETTNDETYDHDMVWVKLLSAREATFLMGCSCGAGRRQLPESAYEKVGLLSRHAYSLLDVKEVNGARLVRLRNPWGQFVWKGAWSDKSELWTPELRRVLMPDGPQSGVFWMPFEEFCYFFDSVDICKVRRVVGWKELRLPGVLPPHWLDSHSQVTRLIVNEPTEVSLTLFQEGSRRENTDQLDLMILVVREGFAPKSVGEFVLKSKRTVAAFVGTKDTFLPAGSYLVVSCSFNHWGTSHVPKSVLAVHSSKSVVAENIHAPPTVLADALIALVLKEGRMHSALPGCVPRYISHGIGGLLLVMDNLMEDACVQIQVDCSQSKNVVSTRGSMVMADTIPPMHRQIVVILSHFEPSQSYFVMHRITHRVTGHAGLRDWAPAGVDKNANHDPPLNEFVHGLHSPRPLFI